MRKLISIAILFLSLMLSTVLGKANPVIVNSDNTCDINRPTKIAIIHSYDLDRAIQEKQGTTPIQRITTEFPAKKLRIRSYFLMANHKTSANSRAISASVITTSIKKFDPDYILVYDDHVMQEIVIPNFLDKKIFLFCVSNEDWREIQTMVDLKKTKIYGSIYTIETAELFHSMEDSAYPTQDIYVLVDGSSEAREHYEYIRDNVKGKNITVLTSKSKSDLRKNLIDIQGRRQGILVVLIHSLLDDSNNFPMDDKEIFSSIKKLNKKHFEVTIGVDATPQGMASSLVCKIPGEPCATTDILLREIGCKHIDNAIMVKKTRYIVNDTRAKELGFGDIEANFEHIDYIVH